MNIILIQIEYNKINNRMQIWIQIELNKTKIYVYY